MFSQDWMGEARCGSSGANQQGFSGSPGSIGEQGGGFDLTRQESQVSMISGGTGMVLRRQESQESSNRSVRSGGMGMGIMLASTGGMRGGSPGKAPSPFRQTRGPSGGELNTSLSKPKLPFQRQNSWAVAPLLPSAPVTVAGMLGIKPGTPSVQRVGSNSPPPMSRQSSALQSVGSMQRGDSVGSDFRMTRENSASFLPILSPIAPSSAPSASTSSPSPAPSGPASASTKMAAMMDSIRGVLQAPVPLKMGRPGDVFGTALSAKEGVGAGDSSKGAGSNKEAGSNKGAGSMKAPGSRKGGSIKVGTKSPNLSPEQAVKTPESDKAHEDGRVQFADGGGMGLGGLGGLGGIGGMGGGMRGNSPLSLSLAMTHLPSERRISVFKPAHESPTQGLVGDRGSIVGRGSAVWSAGTDEEGGGGGGGGMDIDHLVTFSRRGSTLSSLNAMLTTRRASETGKGGLGLGSWTGMMEEGEGESSEDGDNFRWGGEEDSEVSSEAENEALMDTYYDKEAGMQDTGLVVANLHADPLYAVLREEVEKEREWEAHRPRSHHQTKTPSRVGSGMGWVGQEGQGQGQEQTEGQVEGMQEQGQQGRRLITPPSLKLISSFTSLPPAVWVTCRVVYFLLMSYYECVVRVGSAAYRAYLMMEPLWAEMEKQHLRGLCMEQVELEFSWPLLQTLMAKYPVLTTKAFQVMELGLPSAETGTSVGFFNAFPPTKLIYLRDLIKHNMGLFQASQLAHVLPVAAALCAWSKRVIAKVYASCLRRLREVQSKSRTGAALHAVYHQPYRSCLEEGAEGEAKEEEEGPTLPPNLLFVLAVEDALDDTAITAMRVQMQLQMLDRETADGDTGGTGGTGGPGGPGSADAGASATATASASASALASVLTLSSTLALALGLVRPVDRLEVLLVPPPLIAVDMQLNALALEEQAVQANKQTRTHTLQLQMPSRAHTGEGGNGSGVLTPMQRVRSLWSQVLTVYEAHLREFAFSPLHRVMLLPPPLVVDAEKERTGRERGMGERWEEEKEKEKEKVVGGKYARHRSKSAFFTGFNIGDIDTGVDGGDGNGKIRHNSLDFVDSVGSGGGGGVEGGRLPLQIGLTVMLGEGQEQLLERLGPLFPASAFALQRHGLHPVLEHALSKRGEKEGKQRGGALTASVASISSPPQSPSRARSGSTDSLQGQSSKRLQSPKRLQSTKEGQGQGLKMAKGKGGLGTVQPDVLIVRMRGGAVPVPTLLSPAYSASPRIKSLSMRFSLVLVDEKAPPPQRPLSRPAHRPEGTHPQTLSQSQSLSRSSHTVQPAVALTSGPNKYLLCVEDSPGSWLAFQLVCRLARPSDTVALVHVPVLRHHVRGGGGWGGDGDTDEGCSYLTLEEYNLLAVHCTRRAEHLSSVYKSAGHNLYVGPVPSYAEEMQARQKGLERVNKMEALLAEGGGKGGGWGESIVAKVTHTEVMKPVQIVHNKRGSWSVGVTAVALSKFRASLTSAKNSRSMSMSSVGPGRLSQAEAMKAAAAAVLAIEAAETVAAVVEAATAAATAAAAAEALKAAQRRDRCTSFLASQQTHRLASQLLTLAQELRPTFLVIGANGKEITRLLTKPTGVDMDVVGMGLGSSLAESGSELGSDTQEAQAQYVQHCAQSVEVAGEVLRLYRECEGGEGGGSDNDGIRFSFILSNSSAVQAGD
ncbi:hypothetical protein B484DRAFT_453769 [Ochromonadaceae sp. CCMP2298]|nr:hypothetical protein B484DRAFT_453769 [Ochromonadaceae sp. CCMP2298]